MIEESWSKPRLLSPGGVRTLAALARTLVPMDAAEVPFGGVDLVARIEAVFEGENPLFLRGSKLSLAILEWSPLFFGFGFTRFSSLTPEGRARYIQRWEDCADWRLRNVFYGCKVLVLSVLYDDPGVAGAVGYRS